MGLIPELQLIDKVDINTRQAMPARTGCRNISLDISRSERNERCVLWDQALKLYNNLDWHLLIQGRQFCKVMAVLS